MKKLQHICDKMLELRRSIDSADRNDTLAEDVEVMKEELDGLKDLVLEDAVGVDCSESHRDAAPDGGYLEPGIHAGQPTRTNAFQLR